MSEQTSPGGRRRVGLLVVVWALAVPAAAVLGVLALRSAGADSAATVLSASEAASLATASPPVGTPTPAPTPTAAPTPDSAEVVERRVPGAVLGLTCDRSTPVLVWSVPDPGWRVEQAEPEDGDLRVRLEADDDEVRVRVACVAGTPEVVEAERTED